MSEPFSTDTVAFHAFLGQQLQLGGTGKSPEEWLALWRAEHPLPEELQASVAALQEAIADMEAGDVGRPAHEVVADLWKKYNTPPTL